MAQRPPHGGPPPHERYGGGFPQGPGGPPPYGGSPTYGGPMGPPSPGYNANGGGYFEDHASLMAHQGQQPMSDNYPVDMGYDTKQSQKQENRKVSKIDQVVTKS